MIDPATLHRRPSLAIAGIGVLAMTAGLMMAGGPSQGGKERRDAVREENLDAISDQLACAMSANQLVLEPGPVNPAALVSDGCEQAPRLNDPYTGEPYRIELLDDGKLRLCAGFELPPPAIPQPLTRYAPVREVGDCMAMILHQNYWNKPTTAPSPSLVPEGGSPVMGTETREGNG